MQDVGFESDADGTAEEAAAAGCGHSLVWEPPDVPPQERRTAAPRHGWGCGFGERRQGQRRSQPETLEGPSDIAQSPE